MITHNGKPVWFEVRGRYFPLTHGKEPNGTFRARVFEPNWFTQSITAPENSLIKKWLTEILGPFSKTAGVDRRWWIGGATQCCTILPKYELIDDGGSGYRRTNVQDVLRFRNYFFRNEEDWLMFCLRWL